VQNFIKPNLAVHGLATVDFNREYLWNGSSNRQAENGIINYDFSHVRRKQLGKLWTTSEKMTLTFDL